MTKLVARFIPRYGRAGSDRVALLAALIGLVTVTAMKALQLSISTEFDNISAGITAAS